MLYRILPVVVVLVTFWVSNCAVPVAPTGGPTDATSPVLRKSTPENGSVAVIENSVEFEFSEYLNQRSFVSALTVTPQPPVPPKIRWNRRRVTLTFEDGLLPETTYLVQLSNSLSDLNGVKLKAPITVAFSTGAVIDQGTLTGSVVDARSGQGLAGIDLFAFADTITTLKQRPLYTTQTGSNGDFGFSYLAERNYIIVGTIDRNNNRIIDANEPVAVSASRSLAATTDSSAIRNQWVFGARDIEPPTVRTSTALSNTRGRVRFSEEVKLVNHRTSDLGVDWYQVTANSSEIFFRLGEAGDDSVHLNLPLVTDSTGNATLDKQVDVRMSSAPDTVTRRLITIEPRIPDVAISAANPLALSFSDVVTEGELRSLVTIEDSTGGDVDYAVTKAGPHTLVTPEFPTATTIEIRVLGPVAGVSTDSTLTRSYELIPRTRLGAIVVPVIASADSPLVLELVDPRKILIRSTSSTAARDARLTDLIPGTYGLRYYADSNANGTWDAGSWDPFTPHEPIGWVLDSISVRARFDTVLPDTISSTD